MSPVDLSIYPDNWEELKAIALMAAHNKCSGCGVTHLEDGTNGTCLTTHHPDRDPRNKNPRLTILCARCHLAVEAIARRLQRIRETQTPGESLADAWHRAQEGISHEQESLL